MGYLVLIYALIIFAGGIIGYVKAGSMPSIIMGTIFGTLLAGSAIGMLRHRHIGKYAALGLTFALIAFFTYRYMVTGKFMPAGLMSVISSTVALILLFRD